jgi:WXG100 family type VII secretion target
MIYISSQQLCALSAQIGQEAEEMESLFQRICQEMHGLEACWSSPASRAFQEEFKTLNPVFTSYVQTCRNFSQYLYQTAISYEETDSLIARNAAS